MKRRGWVGWVLTLGLLSGGVVALLSVPVVRQWEIHLPEQTQGLVDEASVRALLKPYEGQRFLMLSLSSVRQALRAHPWVADARVVRIWPDRVRVDITLQRPVARWGDAGLVNGRGEVFRPPAVGDYAQLLRLDGPDPRQAGALLALAVWLRQQTAFMDWRLVEVRQYVGGSVETRWWPQRTIWLEAARYQAQFRRFLEAWPQVRPDLRDTAVMVDLRYSNGFSIRTKPLNGHDGQNGAQKTEQ